MAITVTGEWKQGPIRIIGTKFPVEIEIAGMGPGKMVFEILPQNKYRFLGIERISGSAGEYDIAPPMMHIGSNAVSRATYRRIYETAERDRRRYA